MVGLVILLAFQGMGWLLYHFLHIPIPPNVMGFLLLALSLILGVVKLEWVEESAQFLLRYLTLFFVPAIVSTVDYLDLIREQAVPIVASMVLSTLVVFLVTGWSAEWMARRKEEKQRESGL